MSNPNDAPVSARVQLAIDELANLKVDLDRLSAEYDEKKARLLAWFEKTGRTEAASAQWAAHKIQSTRTAIDLDVLSSSVTPDVLDAVTKRTIDLTAFRNAVARGVIDGELAKTVTIESKSSPYLRFDKH